MGGVSFVDPCLHPFESCTDVPVKPVNLELRDPCRWDEFTGLLLAVGLGICAEPIQRIFEAAGKRRSVFIRFFGFRTLWGFRRVKISR